MRVATWNLNRCRPGGSARAEQLQSRMAAVAADVWVLTETHRDFPPCPGYRLVSHSADAPDRDTGRGECWVAIWSRLPAERVELTADLERVAAARVGGYVVVVGTVLPWLADDRHPDVRGEAAFRARLAEQAADWRRLGREPGSGLCVAGDFNQDLLTSGHYYGSKQGREALREALASAGLECLTGGEDDPLAGVQGIACIDHICVRGLRPNGPRRSTGWPVPGELPNGLTDHYGVWVEFEAPNDLRH
jgi:hypothetical protein